METTKTETQKTDKANEGRENGDIREPVPNGLRWSGRMKNLPVWIKDYVRTLIQKE
jgi:hypothetical protein